jgi:hypothetical protein
MAARCLMSGEVADSQARCETSFGKPARQKPPDFLQIEQLC